MQSTIRSLRPFSSATPLRRCAKRSQLTVIRASAHRGSASECSTSGSDNIWWRSLATLDVQKTQPVAAAALLVLGMAATSDAAFATELSDAHSVQPLADLAESDFWGNMVRYGRYFVTVMLGTGYVMLRPLQSMMKKPLTAILAIGAIVALVIGTRIALEFMLGINEYDYNPDNYRIASEY